MGDQIGEAGQIDQGLQAIPQYHHLIWLAPNRNSHFER
jgi:hypothetical protein